MENHTKAGVFRERQRNHEVACSASSQSEGAPTPRQAAMRAFAWLCAVPSTLDGNDAVMRPRNCQVAVSMRLGLPVLLEEKSCSLCMQIIDVYGDHAACCSVSSDRIHR